jgi:hypothetical protein
MPAAKDLMTSFAPAALLIGLIHAGWLAGVCWNDPAADFSLIWLAGEFWTGGENPYTEDFAAAASFLFPGASGGGALPAPNWLPLAAIFSLLEPLAASRLWFALNAALLIGASALNVAAFLRIGGQSALFGETEIAAFLKKLPAPTLFMLHAGFILTAGAAAPSLSFGGPSAAVYFGASLLLYSIVSKHDLAGALGFALTLLQPVAGLIFAASLFLSAYGRRALALGGLITFLAAAPALAMAPFPDIAAAIFAWARDHQAATPASGLRHVFSVFGAPDLSPSFFALLALAAVSASCLAGRKRARALKPADMLMIAAAASLALAPLAPSSFVLLGVLVFYAAGLPAPRGAVALLGCVLAWRAGGLPVSGALDGGLYGFLGVAAFALALAAAATAPTRKPQTAPARAPRLPANVILFRASRESSSPS